MNPRLLDLQPSLIRELHGRKQPGDIDLGLGEPVLKPSIEPFVRAVEWVARHGCAYSPTAGFGELREAVAAYVGCGGDQVTITHGSQEALYLALRVLLNPPQDEVLVVEPAYPAYVKMCQMEGIACRTVGLDEADGFAPSADLVLRALRPQTKLVIICSPGNPSGRIWPREELDKLIHGLDGRWLLADEVYRELYYGTEGPTSVVGMGNTIVCGGLSKSHAVTGIRLGWIVTPPQLAAPVARVHQLITTAASTLSQRVGLEILGGSMGEHRRIYAGRRIKLVYMLEKERLQYLEPEGTFYCLLRIPAGDSLRVALELLDRERVVTVPGIAFGDCAANWLRISWVPELSVLQEGVCRIARFLRGE